MLTIGDFARLAGVSVRMLRHYDALGLLEPSAVNPTSGYRLYSTEQLDRVNRLVALKDLGFSLEQVGRLLADQLTVEEMRGMLRLRRAELSAQIEADQARLELVERRLRLIEGDHTMSESTLTEITLGAVRVVRLTDRTDDHAQIGQVVGPLFGRLDETVRRAGIAPTGPSIGTYDAADDGVEIGAAYPVAAEVTEEVARAAGLELATLPAASRAVATTMRGPIDGISRAWQDVSRLIEQADLSFAGQSREVYHEAPMDDPEHWVVELQVPVA